MTDDAFISDEINNWGQLEVFYRDLQDERQKNVNDIKWVFRGQKASCCGDASTHVLETTLERAFRSFGIADEDRRWREREMIREFQRKLYLYTDHVPSRHDMVEWLSLMQHHGAPTRLLDWSYSFWVAVFFAINQLDCGDQRREQAEIWALDIKWFDRVCRNQVKLTSDHLLGRAIKRGVYIAHADPIAQYNNSIVWHLMHRPRPLIIGMNSFRLNERITIQQGMFVLPGDVQRSFMQNLAAIPDSKNHIHVRMLNLKVKERNDILAKLVHMNVNNAVLFPGLDGFAQSQRTRLALSRTQIRSLGIR